MRLSSTLPFRRGRRWASVAAAILISTLPAGAQEGTAVVDARRLPPGSESPRIDGLLSEPYWQSAVPVRGFRQREPLEGAPATDDTEVRVVFDGEALYIGIVAYDSEPDGIVSRILQRDRVLQSFGFGGFQAAGDDVVAIMLDTFHDRRSAVVLATNPNGAEFDALVTDDGGEVNVDWRGVWEVASTRTPEGWSTEFAIPWRSLRFSSDAVQSWGLNVTRFVQRTQEETMWRSWEREGGGFQRVSRAGTLTGMANLPRSGLNLQAKPFVLGGHTRSRNDLGEYETSRELDAGIDLKSEILPGLVLDLTYNTDFAQVEVDDQQVNLTRFSLFFPEKRDFFLENAGVFEFGQRGFFEPPPYLMFFSRQIGIGPDGEVPILGGARLTGRVGRQTIGLLSVGTDDVPGTNQEAFNVVRLKRDVGESAYVGFMATDRRGDGDANTVAGVDFQFYPHPSLNATGFASRSSTDGAGGEGWVYQVAADWETDVWGGFFQFFTADPGATASSGFVTRTDIRRTEGVLRRRFRPGALGIRKIDLRLRGQYQTTVGGRFQDWAGGPWTEIDFDSGSNLSITLNGGETRVDEGFTVAGEVDVPAGRYSADQLAIRGRTSQARWWGLGGGVTLSDFNGGTLRSVNGTATVTPSPSFAFSGSLTRNDVELPGGEFVADIYSFRATWALSTRMSTNALVQYNKLTDDFNVNVRFNFIHRPGSDLFLVLTENRGVGDDLWELQDRGMVAKLTYLVRF